MLATYCCSLNFNSSFLIFLNSLFVYQFFVVHRFIFSTISRSMQSQNENENKNDIKCDFHFAAGETELTAWIRTFVHDIQKDCAQSNIFPWLFIFFCPPVLCFCTHFFRIQFASACVLSIQLYFVGRRWPLF